MTLTKEEKEELRRECCNAKLRCREVWATLLQIRKIEETYSKIHTTWRKRYEAADLKLAEEEKLTRYTKSGKKVVEEEDLSDGIHLLVKLEKSQLIKIKEELEKMDASERADTLSTVDNDFHMKEGEELEFEEDN